jgi:transmembrane sensor
MTEHDLNNDHMNEDELRDRTDLGGDEARGWVVRLASGILTVEEAAAFRNWHAAHPAHALAFAEAKQHWKVVGQATHEMARGAARATANRKAASRLPISRRWLLSGGVAAAAAGIGAVAIKPPFGLWSPVADFSADYHTGIGEIQTVAIRDDVKVQLSTRSRLSLQSDLPDGVRVALLAGEAVVSSGLRPVTVAAGLGETRAVGGRFNLRNDDNVVRVTCLSGTVNVVCGDRATVLRANQQMRYGPQGVSSIAAADPDEITAWQHGTLVLRGQSLRGVIDEVNRYRPGKIVVLNDQLGNRPVALASFHLDRLDEVVSQMEALYGARARYLPGGIVLLS